MLFTGLPPYTGPPTACGVYATAEDVVGGRLVLKLDNVYVQPGAVMAVDVAKGECYAARVLTIVAERGSLPGPGTVTLEPIGTILRRRPSR